MNQKFRDLDESLIVKPIPKYLMERVKYYYERIGVSLADAVRYAFRDKAHGNTIWYKMWMTTGRLFRVSTGQNTLTLENFL